MSSRTLRPYIVNLLLAGGLWLVAGLWHWWPVAALLLVLVELPGWPPGKPNQRDLVRLVAGWAAILALIGYPGGAVARIVITLAYGAWRAWLTIETKQHTYLQAFITQVLVFEAIFIWAAASAGSRTWVTIFVLAGAFVVAQDLLGSTVPDLTLILATTWALVAAELAWVLEAWLVTYVVAGQVLLVPQPMLVLSGVAYCFGSILAAQRRGALSKTRLLEYVLVGGLILAIVVVGTNWRASV